MTNVHPLAANRIDLARGVKHGAIGGVIAGVVFPMFEMAMAAVQGQSAFGPLRMIGAMTLGEQALDPSFSLLAAGAAGMARCSVRSRRCCRRSFAPR